MDESDKVDNGTQYVDDQDISTQTTTNNSGAILNYDIEVQLGILSNRLLHGSYWFLILDLMFKTNLQLMGLARSARVKMADIAFTAEYTVRTLATLNTWLEKGVREVREIVVGKELDGMEEMLKIVLKKHRDLYWESKAMKNTVFQ
jgi:hypothetical protein